MLPAAERQRAADVQVLDVGVEIIDPVVHLGGLARVPELVEAVVALGVTQFQRHCEARAILEIPVCARVRVLETAAHAVPAGDACLESWQFVRDGPGRREQADHDEGSSRFHAGRLSHRTRLAL